MNRCLVIVMTALLLGASPARATNIWVQGTVTQSLNENWRLFGEFQPRWLDRLSREQSTILRAAILYRLDSRFRLGLGAGLMPQYLPTARDETRIFQQLEYTFDSTIWTPSFRARLEERILEFTSGVLWRVRAKAQVSWMPGDFGAYASNEVFFHLNSKISQARSGFDQNRLSIGPRMKRDWLTVEVGYLLQTVRRLSGTHHSDHGLSLALMTNF